MHNMRNGGCYLHLQKKLGLPKIIISGNLKQTCSPTKLKNIRHSEKTCLNEQIEREREREEEEEEESTRQLLPTFSIKHAKVPVPALFL
jgi:hypothetical protein